MDVITTARLTRRFDRLTAVDSLTVQVPTAKVTGFVGPNGSGKSTLIRMLLGLMKPSEGDATVLGEPISTPQRYLGRVGALVENPAFVPGLSARANLTSLARLRGLPAGRVDAVLQTVGLTGRDREPVKRYSLGMKQRLGIAAALLPDPELLILDEPTNGLDPAGIVEIRTLLARLGSSGRSVLVSSHLLSEIETICEHLVVIRFGKLLYSGPIAGLLTGAGQHVDVRAEHDADTVTLVQALRARGWQVAAGPADGVRVSAAAQDAAPINRAAHAAGITLSSLSVAQESLEDVFLAMTGDTDQQLMAARAARGRTRNPVMLTDMADAVRSELVRTRRKGVVLGWLGLTVLATVLINVVMFQVVKSGGAAPTAGPGVNFPTAAALAQPHGLIAGLASAASMLGVITLSFWALVTATDYQTGLIRLLVAARPRRWQLLAGKILALMLWTAAATTVALIVDLIVTPAAADGSGIDVSAWRAHVPSTLLEGWFNLFCALLVWGVFGLALAVLTRSSATAVSVGIGYVLVVESVIRAAAKNVGDWLPGSTLSALAEGGNTLLGYGAALAVGAAYTLAGIGVAQIVFHRRDITD